MGSPDLSKTCVGQLPSSPQCEIGLHGPTAYNSVQRVINSHSCVQLMLVSPHGTHLHSIFVLPECHGHHRAISYFYCDRVQNCSFSILVFPSNSETKSQEKFLKELLKTAVLCWRTKYERTICGKYCTENTPRILVLLPRYLFFYLLT